jgi:hypothetical protein
MGEGKVRVGDSAGASSYEHTVSCKHIAPSCSSKTHLRAFALAALAGKEVFPTPLLPREGLPLRAGLPALLSAPSPGSMLPG